MTKISPRGNPKSPIWCIVERPYEKDSDKGVVYSCPYGFVFDNCWRDAGIMASPFIIAITDTVGTNQDINTDFKALLAGLDMFKPPIICTMGEKVTAMFCPETIKKGKKNDESSLEKWAGSALHSGDIRYEHFVIPQLTPERVVANWEYRFVYVNIDLARVRDELGFLDKNKRLEPLPRRELIIGPQYNELMEILNEYKKASLLSVDIETIRPPKSSEYYGKHPGYPYTISFADSPQRGVSIPLWDYNDEQRGYIFRECDYLLSRIGSIGQNWFTFDSHFLEALGFTICLDKCQDTMLIHQLLWPALPHKLQFLTKQYTRQPYYKDEGKGWSPKNKKALMHYNALDTTVTYEVYLGELEELNDRPYLI